MISPADHFYPFFERCLKEVAARSPVLDLGTFHACRKELGRYRHLFGRTQYFAMDYYVVRAAPGVEAPDVDGDICHLPFATESAGGVICKEVLEHVFEPERAVAEMHRVLKPGGLLYCSVPALYPYHGSPERKYHDLWRFTREGVTHMFRRFAAVEVAPAGGVAFVLKAYAPGRVRLLLGRLPWLVNAADRLIPTTNLTPLWMVRAVK